MSRVLKNELQNLRQSFETYLNKMPLNKQFSALFFLSVIWLHVLAAREEGIQDEEERRCITNEFDQCKRTLTRGIEMLYEQTTRGRNEEPDLPSKRPLP